MVTGWTTLSLLNLISCQLGEDTRSLRAAAWLAEVSGRLATHHYRHRPRDQLLSGSGVESRGKPPCLCPVWGMACCPGRSDVCFSWVLYVSWQTQDSAANTNFKTDYRSDRHRWRLLLSSILSWPYIPKCLYEQLLIWFSEDLLFNVLSSHMICLRLFNPQVLFGSTVLSSEWKCLRLTVRSHFTYVDVPSAVHKLLLMLALYLLNILKVCLCVTYWIEYLVGPYRL